MRLTLLFLTCALVFPVQPLCHAQEAAPPKQSFWKRLFTRSGSTSSSTSPQVRTPAETEVPQYHPYPEMPLVLQDSASAPASSPPPYPPTSAPTSLGRSLYWAHKTSDFFRALGSILIFRGKPAKQDNVASVHMAILGIRAWDDLKKDLETKFTLQPADALKAVVPIVGASAETEVSVNNTSLRVAGPAPAAAPAFTNVPNVTTLIPSTDLSAALAPPTSVTVRNSGATALDPFLQYRTAQSLLQNVTLLNNTIASAPLNDSYDPYVISLQVTLMPHKRDGAYDVYTDITFVDGANHYHEGSVGHASAKQGYGLLADPAYLVNETSTLVPRVIPLLVTDDLEAVSGSNATRKINQFAAALAAATPQVSGTGSYQKYTDAINKFIGEETNALVTVARLQENVFRVRFGANVQANKEHLGMVPQAHTVHLLLLFPKKARYPDVDAHGKQATYYNCNAVAITHMREAKTGRLLRRPTLMDVSRSYYEAVKSMTDADIFTKDIYREENLLELANYVRLNEYRNFQAKAETLMKPEITFTMAQQYLTPGPNARRKPIDYRWKNDAIVMSLWASLSQIFGRSVYSTDNVIFSPVKPPAELKPNHHAAGILATDDGTKLTTTYSGLANLSPSNLSGLKVWLEIHDPMSSGALLNPPKDDKARPGTKPAATAASDTAHPPVPKLTLLPSKAPALTATSGLALEFDSPKKYGLQSDTTNCALYVQMPDETKAVPANFYMVDHVSADKPVAKSTVTVKASSLTIMKKADGTGAYTFNLGIAPSTPYSSYTVTMSGAGLGNQGGATLTQLTNTTAATTTMTQSGDGEYQVNFAITDPNKVKGSVNSLFNLALQNFDASNKFVITVKPGELNKDTPAPSPAEQPATLEVSVVENEQRIKLD